MKENILGTTSSGTVVHCFLDDVCRADVTLNAVQTMEKAKKAGILFPGDR